MIRRSALSSLRNNNGPRWYRLERQRQQLLRGYYVVAHMNYARLKAPMEDPSMDEFRLALDPVNALARATPGFVWSLDDSSPEQREEVTLLREDPNLMPQLSLWKDVESIQHFAFKSGHAMYLKRKREWFTPPCEGPFAVCWWRPAQAEYPTLREAFERLELLREQGPSTEAFDFKSAKNFPMPSETSWSAFDLPPIPKSDFSPRWLESQEFAEDCFGASDSNPRP